MNVFAIEKLYDDVAARFEAEGAGVTSFFGWKEPARQKTDTRRIVWTPGDDGDMGETQGAKFPGGNPRSLATLEELVTVTISAEDAAQPTKERGQYRATRALYDAWYRAVYLAAYGTFQIRRTSWITEKNELRRGAAIRVVLAVQSKIPDQALGTAPVDTSAHDTEIVLDETETQDVTAEG